MGVVNTKSTAITNADATPIVRTMSGIAKARELVAVGTVEVAATDSATSVYRFCRIPSNAIVNSIMLFNDDLDSGTAVTFDCGLHKTATDGGAALDADVFATAIATAQSANLTGVQLRFEAADINGVEKRAWELGALTVDPTAEYDVTMTLGGTLTGIQAGTLTLVVRYTVE